MDNYVKISASSVDFVGSDAVALYRALTLRNAIALHQKSGIIPTRGMGIMKMFERANEFTGKKYKRGDHDAVMRDLTVWIEMMRSALTIDSD